MKYIRKVAIFTLLDNKRNILLQHRDKYAPRLPKMWAFFGGGIKEGETPKEAVMREAYEELQIEPKLKFFKSYDLKFNEDYIKSYLFLGKLNYNLKELKKLQREGDSLAMFSKEEVNKIHLWSGDKRIVKDIFNDEV